MSFYRTIYLNAIKFMLVLGTSFLLAQATYAATVYNCSSNGRKCVVKLEVGSVGDNVRVLDEKARQIATGRIIKKRGIYGIISLDQVAKTIRRGFPVLVDVDRSGSPLEWAASFSYKDR
ncbi:MAG: hypothetical protein R3B45_10415 [Bdellovibrionota bacterium]